MKSEILHIHFYLRVFTKSVGLKGLGRSLFESKDIECLEPSQFYIVEPRKEELGLVRFQLALTAGFGTACELAMKNYQDWQNKCLEIKEVMVEILIKSGIDYHFNGDQKLCMPNTINICLIKSAQRH